MDNFVKCNELKRKIAVVSGKGGSGKTMIAAMIARVFDIIGESTLIIDTDIATGGMTYYLSLKTVKNVSIGLSTLISNKWLNNRNNDSKLPKGLIQPLRGFKQSYFIGVGDTRKLYRSDIDLFEIINKISDYSSLQTDKIIIDCRGGIDEESISVCKSVDDIILVVESDTTSFQSTQHLVEILSDNGLSYKIIGFIINKVFDDPSSIARNGTSVFKSQYLYSIPFDISATKQFLIGEVPKAHSLFGIHVWAALNKAYEHIPEPPGRPWSFKQFSEASITGNESAIGGTVISSLILICSGLLFFDLCIANKCFFNTSIKLTVMLVILTILGFLGSLEPFRRIIGVIVKGYVHIIKRIIHGVDV